jgi:hypothetical protein
MQTPPINATVPLSTNFIYTNKIKTNPNLEKRSISPKWRK